MDTQFEKSMQTLELPAVLNLLSSHAHTQEGKQRCASLRPFAALDDAVRAQEETQCAVSMLLKHGTPSFGGIKPVSHALQRAQMGGSLSMRELLDIAALLRTARNMITYGESDEKNPLHPLFSGLTAVKSLEDEISGSILSEEEIADSASSELASIRRHIRATQGKAREILQKIISSDSAKYLQESLITIRSNRYVVPVKSEHKNAIAGLVHDVSSSGSTFFIEPMGVVKANNELRELQTAEKKEIERILATLSAACAENEADIAQNYDFLILLDCAFAKGNLALSMHASRPLFHEKGICLYQVRHPLLPRDTTVTNDLTLGDQFDTLIITGPNTGGKTVTLKTLGLVTLMAQCGLQIPAKDGSYVRFFSRVLADIGDEQSITQSLSTFSSHMKNIVEILNVADGDTLILFDELGAGTDPTEGAALAAAIIDSARRLGATIAATTHYSELKLYAMTTDGIENASCEFNVETLRPTYRLILGIPGKSNAFAISRRLGLPEYIIEKAAQRLSGEAIRFEDVLTNLDLQRQQLEKDQQTAAALRLEMEQAAQTVQRHRDKLEKERAEMTKKAQAQAQEILKGAQDAADDIFTQLKQLRKQQAKEQNWQQVNDQRAALRHSLNVAQQNLGGEEYSPAEVPPPTRPAAAGDTVYLLSLGTNAVVVSVEKDGALKLQAGRMTITAKQEEVRVVKGPEKTKKPQAKISSARAFTNKAAQSEIDLRGMESMEAVMVLEHFLDNALLGKLESVRIIHGKGTGAVRNAVREYLKKSRYIQSFRPGAYGEGEDGVTVAQLK